MADKRMSQSEVFNLIADAHHDALLVCGSDDALHDRLEAIHVRIGAALAGEQISVALVALTQAVADLGRKFKR